MASSTTTKKTSNRRSISALAKFVSSLRRDTPTGRRGNASWKMEVNGFEPMTPCLQSRCSPS